MERRRDRVRRRPAIEALRRGDDVGGQSGHRAAVYRRRGAGVFVGFFAGFLRNAFAGVTPSQARFGATTRVTFVRYVPIDAGLVKVMLPAIVEPSARA